MSPDGPLGLQIERRVQVPIPGTGRALWVTSAGDQVLRNLDWYRRPYDRTVAGSAPVPSRQGRRSRAFVPTALADRGLKLGPETVARSARAQFAVELGAATMPEDYAALARLLLRAEGVASSFIEGVTAPVLDIVLAVRRRVGRGQPRRGHGGARRSARRRAYRRQHLRLAPDTDGRSPCTGPPRGCRPHRAGVDRRVLFRMGDLDRWVQWFAATVSGAGRAQQELVAAVQDLRRDWEHRLRAPREGMRRLRSNATAWRVLDLLPRHLVLTGPVVAEQLGIPLKSASAALRDLVDADVLVEHGSVRRKGRGRPSRLHTSPELLGLTGSTPVRA
jgi:hypothetical protein